MSQSDSAIGQVFDGYRILEVLGKGGMGIVYKAEDIALSRMVALKMIAPELASNDSFLRRFQSEARALARAESPYIVGIHALRQTEDRLFIIMEYIDGWTLADEIEKGVIEFQRTHSLAGQMLSAFGRAHSVGVIHRDIKPRNIMISRTSKVKVTDFGLAKLRRDDGASTVTQGMAGTIRYMSPEQVHGSKVDHRSDLYSLGMTLYEMLAGQLPFGFDEGTFAMLKRIVEEEFPPPSHFNPNVPQPLCDIAMKAISKAPDDRFQSAEEMWLALDKAYKTPVAPTPQTRTYVDVPPRTNTTSKKKNLVMLAAGLALIIGVYPLYSFFSGGESVTPPVVDEQPAVVFPADDSLRAPQLSVISQPAGAMVYVDESLVGAAPVNRFEVSEGDVAISLRMAGFSRVDTTLSVVSGQHTDLRVQLVELVSDLEPVGNSACCT